MTALVLTSRIYARAPEMWPKSLSLQGESICFALFGHILRLASFLCLGRCATCSSLHDDRTWRTLCVPYSVTGHVEHEWHDMTVIHGNSINFRTLLSNFTWLYGKNFFQLWLVADFPYYIFLLWFPPLANSSTSLFLLRLLDRSLGPGGGVSCFYSFGEPLTDGLTQCLCIDRTLLYSWSMPQTCVFWQRLAQDLALATSHRKRALADLRCW